jgi:hypothetical protein
LGDAAFFEEDDTTFCFLAILDLEIGPGFAVTIYRA